MWGGRSKQVMAPVETKRNLLFPFRFSSGTDPLKPLETFVNIEYLTWPIIKYKREVLFGWVDLLVSFGGIAGLFLGFSLLSGVEIIYYFTLRAICMVYKSRVSTKQAAVWAQKHHVCTNPTIDKYSFMFL